MKLFSHFSYIAFHPLSEMCRLLTVSVSRELVAEFKELMKLRAVPKQN